MSPTVTVTVTDRSGNVSAPASATWTTASPTTQPLIGRSSSNHDHGAITAAPLVRCYRFGEVASQIAQAGATHFYLSDEPGVTTATQLRNELDDLFDQYPNLTVDWMPENEITAWNNPSQATINAYIAKSEAHANVVADYPNVRMSVNLTAYGVRQNRHLGLAPIADHLDSAISSCYNPGRTDSPPTWDAYSFYMDPILDCLVSWGVPVFGVGEFGNPIMPGQPTRRPTYAAGFLKYVRGACQQRGLTFHGASWWDNQKSGGPDNKLLNDNALGAGSTATAWKNALN